MRGNAMDLKILTDDTPWEPACMARHIGPWMVEPKWFTDTVAAVKAGLFQVQETEPPESSLYALGRDGIATIGIIGSMMKGDSKFGGTNTLRTRRAVRRAVSDQDVKAVMLHIDSPGGMVAGTGELANDVRQANTQKPVYAHIEDTGASAAYWVASQARRITATPTSEVGSIGVVAVVEDSSGAAEMEGIKVHVVASAPLKGAFADGAPVTSEQLDYLKGLVRELNSHFLAGVSKGRGMPIAAVREVADGRVHLAANALAMGLIDAVSTLDEAVKFVRTDLRKAQKMRQKVRVAQAGSSGIS